MTSVIVLNADYQTHQIVSLNKAMSMLVREVAVVEEAEEGRTIGPFPRPRVLRLVRYVYIKWKHSADKKAKYSRNGVLRRDKYTCAFCEKFGNTVDHILPSSRGGRTDWMNCITSCLTCNNKKRDMTPHEAKMPLMFSPFVPTYSQLNK